MFRLISDLKRHKCITERQNFVRQQSEAIECRPVRDILESKEAIHYTNALEDLFVTLSLSPLEEERVGTYVCVVL